MWVSLPPIGTLTLSQTTESQISGYAILFEKIIEKVRKYGERQDLIAGTIVSSPFADAADLCSNKLINYYQFVDNEFVMVATVLDPRAKLAIYNLSPHKLTYRTKAERALKQVFSKYSEDFDADQSGDDLQISAAVTASNNNQTTSESSSIYQQAQAQNSEENSSEAFVEKGEVERYLEAKMADPKSDPLQWWRKNQTKYPILSEMARDYLAIQCSSKDAEGAFSKGRRQMPYYRQSLKELNFKAQMLVNSGEALGLF